MQIQFKPFYSASNSPNVKDYHLVELGLEVEFTPPWVSPGNVDIPSANLRGPKVLHSIGSASPRWLPYAATTNNQQVFQDAIAAEQSNLTLGDFTSFANRLDRMLTRCTKRIASYGAVTDSTDPDNPVTRRKMNPDISSGLINWWQWAAASDIAIGRDIYNTNLRGTRNSIIRQIPMGSIAEFHNNSASIGWAYRESHIYLWHSSVPFGDLVPPVTNLALTTSFKNYLQELMGFTRNEDMELVPPPTDPYYGSRELLRLASMPMLTGNEQVLLTTECNHLTHRNLPAIYPDIAALDLWISTIMKPAGLKKLTSKSVLKLKEAFSRDLYHM